MPLSDDQRAMLRLLAQREQGYEDIAALMGISVGDVRAKVTEALAQLEDEGIEPPPLPAEPPLAAQPVPPAPEPPKPDPAPPEPEPPKPDLVPPVAKQPEPVAPVRPEPPVAREPERPAGTAAEDKSPPPVSPPPGRPASGPPKLSLPAGRGARAALAAAAVAVIAVVVVLIVSGGGGSDSTTSAASTTASSEGSTEAETTPTPTNAAVTKAVLKPVGGGSATGVAIFGRVKNSLALQVEAEGLEPISKSQSYTIWLAQSPQRMLPLASTPLDKKGRIAAQFEVPTEVLAYLANGTFDQLVITRTANAALKAALAKATKEERAPTYTGTEAMRGTVTGPIVGAQLRKEAEEKEGK